MTQSADERLILFLEARVAEFEKRMASAERRATGNFRGMQRGSKSATAAMERDMITATARINAALATTSSRIGQFSRGFIGGLLGGVSIAALSQTVRGIAQIGDEARRAGVGLRQFQELRYVAEQNRIGVDQLVDGLKELSLRTDEFVTTGAGPAAEAFGRLGYNAAELRAALADPSELLLEIIGRMEGLNNAAQIRVADEVFGGTAGERFVQLLAQGEAGIRRTMRGAREAGAVLDDGLIHKAAELDRRFNEIATSAGNFFKWIIVKGADAGLAAVELVAQVANLHAELRGIDDLFRNPDQATAILGEAGRAAIEAEGVALADHAATVSALLLEYERLAAGGNQLVPVLSRVAGELRRVGEDQAAAVLDETAAAMANLSARLDAGQVSADTFEWEFGQLIDRAGEAMAAVQSVDSPTFAGVISRLGDLKTKLGEVMAAAFDLRAALPGGAADPASLPLAPSDGSSIITWGPDKGAPTTRPWNGNTVDLRNEGPARTAPSGGRGGGSGRLDSLIAELQTEREVLAAWYEESAALLASATDAELEALGGRHEAVERLEAEHMERLREVRAAAQSGILAEAGSFFGAMADAAAAGGDKMQKAARFFGALEAAANVGVAQSQVLKDPLLPWWKKIPAALAIGAAGARIVANIKGGSVSGGGGGAGGGGSEPAAPAAAPAAPLEAILRPLDPRALFTGEMVTTFFDALQAEAGARGLRLSWGNAS